MASTVPLQWSRCTFVDLPAFGLHAAQAGGACSRPDHWGSWQVLRGVYALLGRSLSLTAGARTSLAGWVPPGKLYIIPRLARAPSPVTGLVLPFIFPCLTIGFT